MTLPQTDAPDATGAPRASHADREHAARVVHTAAGEGMLTLEEAEERLSAVYAARFRHELAPLLSDLPVDDPAATPPAAGVGARLLRAWAVVGALALSVTGWANRHRVAAVLLGVLALGVAASLVLVLGDALGGDGPHGEGHGAGMMEP
ncbi:hypothetical protein GCM10027047_11940 [Rhodococcus aerolatus]